jgi:CheY-like chemotaxis protein
VLLGVRHRKNGLEVGVYDTGIGIPENKQKDIFKEFSRLQEGAKIAQGFGLGLSIVQRICAMLHYPLVVKSRTVQNTGGHGSVFSFAIPETHDASSVQEDTRPPLPTKIPSLAGLRIAILDNDKGILLAYQGLLKELGCATIISTDLAPLLATIEQQKITQKPLPDLIIVDYHLNHGTGIEAVEVMREQIGRHVPAIMVTAERSTETRRAAQAEDIYVLYKPSNPQILLALISQLSTLKRE